MNIQESAERLTGMLNRGVTPYHAVMEGIRQLKENGFWEWKLTESGPLQPSGAYYTCLYGTTLAAFRMPKGKPLAFRIAAAHTDSPLFRIKPNPDVFTPEYHKLNVEAYGGAIYNTWFDRPLHIAGRVCLDSGNPFAPEERLYCSAKPAAVIPNLAIHMNREVNKGTAVSVQNDMEALLSVRREGSGPDRTLKELVADELGVEKDRILDSDLMLTNAGPAVMTGFDGSLIESPRLDNLTSCQSCLNGLLAAESSDNTVSMIILFDNEECGSRSKQGAASTLFVTLLEKLMLASGETGRDAFLNAMLSGFVLSLDVAHAVHPSHPEKSDPTNRIRLDGGVILKMNSNQKYATDAAAVSAIEAICRHSGIAMQKFVNNSDIAGGGTLGSILSATVPVRTVDAGIPLLAMHSANELIAASSQNEMDRLLEAYFGTFPA